MKQYAPIILRIGTALVFLWFGLSQLIAPAEWTGWLPSYVSSVPLSATTFVYLNGAFETLFGLLLLVGFYTRLAALLLALHMAHIITVVGYGEIAVRDFAIFTAALSLALWGRDLASLDTFFFKKKVAEQSLP